MEIKLFIDGGARGNPGPAGIGAIAYKSGKVLFEIGEYIGDTTNNTAEYFALIRGLEEALTHGVKNISVCSDSELLVRQINGQYKVKNEQLKMLHIHAKKLIKKFDKFIIHHIPREENKEADKLANLGIISKNQNCFQVPLITE